MSAQTTIVLQGAATCEDDFFDEIGGYRVTLSEHDLSQIEALRCAVRAVAAYRITNWCWSAEWFATDPTDTEDDELSAERVDTGQMHVTADEVWFSGYPKHTSIRVVTDSFRIDDLHERLRDA